MRARRILAIFDDCGPGDAVAAAFLLDAIRAAHPAAEIVVLAGQNVAEIFERSTVPNRVVVSRLYVPFPRHRLGARLEKLREAVRLAWRLRPGFDLALTFFWGTFALSVLAFLVARRRIGYMHRPGFLQSGELGPYDPFGDPVQQNLAVLAAGGIEPNRPRVGRLVPMMPRHHPRGSARPAVVLHAGSDWACQQWSVASWARLADALIDEYGVHVQWTGGASERAYVEMIQGRMRGQSVSMCGETARLSALSELLAEAALCVSVDSVPWELSLAEGTPTIVLTGPRLPNAVLTSGGKTQVINRTRPDVRRMIVSCQAGFPHGVCHDYSCPLSQLRHISVEDVMRAVVEIGALTRMPREAAAR
jgi:ADP-heptose:LPS heptosyltransferase